MTATPNANRTLDEQLAADQQEVDRLEAEIAELKKALDDDAADLWKVTNAIKKEIAMREWIMEGRGCYEWDDERYQQETRWAFDAVLELIKNVQHSAQIRFHQTMNPSPAFTEADLEDNY